MNRLLVLLFTLFSITLFAQSTEKYKDDRYAAYHRAEDLYAKEQYSAARNEFRSFIDLNKDKNDPFFQKALYYEGLSALELYNNDAIKLLENFLTVYPESIFQSAIHLKIARFHFQKKDYKLALASYQKVKLNDVPNDDRDEYHFKVGMSHFNLERYSEARSSFYEIKDGSSQYAVPALYYYSHIAYQDKSYQIALEGFEKLSTNKAYKEIVPYYITQIYYMQGRYTEVTKFAPYLMDSIKQGSRAGMSHIVGDAFYRIGKYDEAVPFLEKYNKTTQTTRDEDYQLAFAYYKSSMYPQAIQLLDKVTRTKDSLGQIAYYQIAECYLKQGKEGYARAAFKEAYEMSYNKKIQEDALYNYAVLSYNLAVNPYDEALTSFLLYLEKYPNSDRKNVVYQNLVNVYSTTKNYESALTSLEKHTSKDIRLKSAYQLIAFNRGVQLFQSTDYKNAISAFEKSLIYPIDSKITAESNFWIAESNFYLKNYTKAISMYKSFIATPGANVTTLRAVAHYNLGYAYMATGTKDNNLIIEAFRSYLEMKQTNKQKTADATMRVADQYYVQSKNEEAITYYKKVIEQDVAYQDQALYYLSRTYGFVDDKKTGTNNKIKYLTQLINNYPKSKYIQQSILEIGKSYRYLQDYDNALKYFNQIIEDYPNSNLEKETWIDIADIYQKKQNFTKAESIYQEVLQKYGADRATCKACVESLVEMYRVQKDPSKIEKLVSKYTCSDYTVDDAEEIFYHNAVNPYLDSNYREAIPELTTFISKFPKGKYTLEMKAHLADAYYQLGNLTEAITQYEDLLENPKTKYSELAAIRVSRYYYNAKNYASALKYYAKLEKITASPEVLYNTTIGMMRTNFILENWEDGIKYAQVVLVDKQINNSIKLEAQYVIGIGAYKIQDYDTSIPALEWICKNTNTELAAESYFTLASIYFQKSELNSSEAQIRSLLKMTPAYNYWIAKCLILQTKVLIAKDDLFQAEHTLLSVLENYPNQNDGIISEANEQMNELLQLKNRPKEVEEQFPPVIEVND